MSAGTPSMDAALGAPARERLGFAERVILWLGVGWLVVWLASVVELVGERTGINLYYPVVAFYLLLFLGLRTRNIARLLGRPLFWMWIVITLAAAVIYFVGQRNPYSYVAFRGRIVYLSVVLGTAMFMLEPTARRMLRRAGLLTLAVAVPLNVYEVVVGPVLSESLGRAAGLYLNPNASSAALAVCTLLAVDVARASSRDLWILAFATAGVLPTFSRQGILFMLLLWGLMLLRPGARRLPQLRRRTVTLLLLAVGGVLGIVGLLSFADLSQDAIERLRFFVTLEAPDDSAKARQIFVSQGIEAFRRAFWSGWGLGSMHAMGLQPHNTFLRLGIEFGIAGVGIYAAILLAGIAQVLFHPWHRSANAVVLAFFLAYISFFQHVVDTVSVFAVAFGVLLGGGLITPNGPGTAVGAHASAQRPSGP